jgi:hypothetical protein
MSGNATVEHKGIVDVIRPISSKSKNLVSLRIELFPGFEYKQRSEFRLQRGSIIVTGVSTSLRRLFAKKPGQRRFQSMASWARVAEISNYK